MPFGAGLRSLNKKLSKKQLHSVINKLVNIHLIIVKAFILTFLLKNNWCRGLFLATLFLVDKLECVITCLVFLEVIVSVLISCIYECYPSFDQGNVWSHEMLYERLVLWLYDNKLL